MTNDFDKEMDSLLRQTARNGEAAFNGKSPSFADNTGAPHVDADEISLFAENALPVKTRARLTEHLADCDRCRKILSNLIALNPEAVSENVRAKEIAVATAPLPWYKKLFVFPQIAYTMGALALVFSGVIALTVWQNSGYSLNTGIAQRESAPMMSGETANTNANVAAAPETYTLSNSSTAATANTNSSNTLLSAANTSITPSVNPSAPPSNFNSSLAASEESGGRVKPSAKQKDNVPSNEKPSRLDDLALAKPPPPAKKENFVEDGLLAKTEKESRAERDENQRAREQTVPVQAPPVQNRIGITSDLPSAKRSAPAARAEDRKTVVAESADAATGAKTKSAETRTAGGKSFKRAEGIWYDTAYKGGKTINVRRGTGEYKKLDKGLRSIAEQIGGTVVVVWKSKAYRIQ